MENKLAPAIKKDLMTRASAQICIDNTNLFDFLGRVHDKVKIRNLVWRSDKFGTEKSLEIPKAYRACGLTSMRETKTRMRFGGSFKNKTKSDIYKGMAKLIKKYDIQPESVMIRQLEISDGNGSAAVFNSCKKEIRTDSDKRRKLAVLGLEKVSRNNKFGSYDLVDTLHPKKFKCRVIKQERPAVVCSVA